MKAEVDLSENDIQMVILDMRATSLIWVISGCAGPSAARQVNLNKRTPRTRASSPGDPSPAGRMTTC